MKQTAAYDRSRVLCEWSDQLCTTEQITSCSLEMVYLVNEWTVACVIRTKFRLKRYVTRHETDRQDCAENAQILSPTQWYMGLAKT